MIDPKMRRMAKEILLPALIAVLVLGVLGSWTYALVLNLKVRRAMKVDLPPTPSPAPSPVPSPAPNLAKQNEPRKSGQIPGQTPGPAPHPTAPGASPASAPSPVGGSPAAPPAMPKELEALVKAKGLFGRQPEPGPPTVQGIMGDSALVNGQWMQKGVPSGNIVVKEIEGNKVVLEVNGQRSEMTIWPQMPGT